MFFLFPKQEKKLSTKPNKKTNKNKNPLALRSQQHARRTVSYGKMLLPLPLFPHLLVVLVTPATSVLSSLLVIFLLKEMLGNSTWSLFLIFSIHLVNVLAQLNNSNENSNFHCFNTLRFICNTFTNSKPQFSSPQERKSSCD